MSVSSYKRVIKLTCHAKGSTFKFAAMYIKHGMVHEVTIDLIDDRANDIFKTAAKGLNLQ
jgi:hypothetical protein